MFHWNETLNWCLPGCIAVCLLSLSYAVSTRCTMSMGMRNLAIQDYQLSASAAMSGNPPSESRPHGVGWCAKFTEHSPYLQVNNKCIEPGLSQTKNSEIS